jgi:hypothetical protein
VTVSFSRRALFPGISFMLILVVMWIPAIWILIMYVEFAIIVPCNRNEGRTRFDSQKINRAAASVALRLHNNLGRDFAACCRNILENCVCAVSGPGGKPPDSVVRGFPRFRYWSEKTVRYGGSISEICGVGDVSGGNIRIVVMRVPKRGRQILSLSFAPPYLQRSYSLHLPFLEERAPPYTTTI